MERVKPVMEQILAARSPQSWSSEDGACLEVAGAPPSSSAHPVPFPAANSLPMPSHREMSVGKPPVPTLAGWQRQVLGSSSAGGCWG